MTALVFLLCNACGSSGDTEVKKPKNKANKVAEAKRLLKQARRAEERGQPNVAGKKYARALRLRPKHYGTAEGYTRFLIAEGDPDKAVKVASKFLSRALGELKGYHLLADAQMAAGDLIGAHETLTELLELDEGDSSALEKRGRVQLRRENFKDAITDVKKALEIQADNPDYRATLGEVYLRSRQFKAAAIELRGAIKLDNEHPKAHILLGNVLRREGDTKEALEMHKQAVRFAPDSARAHFELGITQNYAGDNPGAEISLKKATELGPNDALHWYAYGEVLRNMKRYSEAVPLYREALEIEPDHAKAANKLGVVLFHAGKFDEAESVLTERVRNHPDDPYPYFNLGQVYAKLEKYRLAVEAFQKFLDLAPKNDGDVPTAKKKIRTLKRKIR